MAENLYLDVDFETARALHRVVRAMHDGECPKCHWLFESILMRGPRVIDPEPGSENMTFPKSFEMVCPACGFTITDTEAKAALDAFAPVMGRNLEIFEEWRKARKP